MTPGTLFGIGVGTGDADGSDLETARHAHRRVLEARRNAAFLTLGDSLIYSTYGYILHHLIAMGPYRKPLVSELHAWIWLVILAS